MNDSQAYEILINWLSQLNLPCCEIVYTRDNVMECYITAWMNFFFDVVC